MLNRGLPIKLFRDSDTKIQKAIKFKSVRVSKKHNSTTCIRNWYHIKEIKRDILKKYNMVIT